MGATPAVATCKFIWKRALACLLAIGPAPRSRIFRKRDQVRWCRVWAAGTHHRAERGTPPETPSQGWLSDLRRPCAICLRPNRSRAHVEGLIPAGRAARDHPSSLTAGDGCLSPKEVAYSSLILEPGQDAPGPAEVRADCALAATPRQCRRSCRLAAISIPALGADLPYGASVQGLREAAQVRARPVARVLLTSPVTSTYNSPPFLRLAARSGRGRGRAG